MSGAIITVIVTAYLFAGLAIGSFLNVVIYRVPRGLSVISPPSRCSNCGYQLKPWDNIPILSYFLLRGRCRSCGVRFGVSYVVVEALNLFLWASLLARLGLTFTTLIEAIFSSVLLAGSVIDIKTRTIPRTVIYLGITMVVLLTSADSIFRRDYNVLWRSLLLGTISFLIFFSIFVFSKNSIGFGEVRLSFLIGFAVGIYGYQPVIDFFYLSFASAALYGLVLIIRSKGGRKTKIAFGPFMAIGAYFGLMLLNSIHILG